MPCLAFNAEAAWSETGHTQIFFFCFCFYFSYSLIVVILDNLARKILPAAAVFKKLCIVVLLNDANNLILAPGMHDNNI